MKKYSLIGVNGNAWAVMAYVRNAMKETGYKPQRIEGYSKDAMAGNYDNLLCVSQDMIDEINERIGE